MRFRRLVATMTIICSLFSITLVANAGSIDWEMWFDLPGNSIEDLIDADILDSPADAVETFRERLDTRTIDDLGDNGDEYGSRIRGYLQALTSGSYTFFLGSDDASTLSLSTDIDPENAVIIAQESDCCAPLYSGARIEQRMSDPIALEKGAIYFLEVLHKEGGGGDYIEIAWERPDGTREHIPTDYLLRWAPANATAEIEEQPKSVAVSEGTSATFSITVSVAQPATFQWLMNGTPIDGAILQTYTLESPTLADNNAQISVEITAPNNTKTISDSATLTVDADATPPSLTKAVTRGNPESVTLTFTVSMEAVTATDPENYSIDGGASILAAAPGNTPNEVTLTITELDPSIPYTVTVKEVVDRAQTPNTISPNPSSVAVSQSHGVITRKIFTDIPGRLLSDLTENDKFPDSPDSVDFMASFETPSKIADNYGVQIQGFITPLVDGDYIFYLSTGNEGALFLSPDDDPSKKMQIASEPVDYFVPRAWEEPRPDDENISEPQSLLAGKRYYIEALMKAGAALGDFTTRQDNLAVAWQMVGDDALLNGAPPLRGEFLSAMTDTGPVKITSAPQGVTIDETRSARLIGEVNGTPPYEIQSFKNGEIITGATSAELFLPSVPLTDDGAAYTVRVANHFSEITSSEAKLVVTKDTVAPALQEASARNVNTSINVVFSEVVDQESAENPTNYSIDQGVTISSAELIGAGDTVVLTTSEMSAGTRYSVTVNHVRDLAADPNTVAENATVSFTFFGSNRVTRGLRALYSFLEGEGETVGDVSGIGTALDLEIEERANVTWLPQGGLSINQETRIVSGAATKISAAYRESGKLTVEVWTRSLDFDQDGPARIVSVSEGSGGGDRNFSLNQGMWNQNAPDSQVWSLRLSQNSSDGATWLTEFETVTGEIQHVVASVDTEAGEAIIYVDGEESAFVSTTGDFSDFKDDRLLVVGNENSLVGSGRHYLGEVYLVAIYDQALTPDEVSQNFSVGIPVTTPRPFEITAAEFVDDAFRIKWTSNEGEVFRIERSDDLQLWEEQTDGHPSGGEETTYVDDRLPPDSQPVYFRVHRE